MKVLFLDIDGVLNSTRTAVAFGGYPTDLTDISMFDHAALGMIRRMCKAGDVSVCLSSAWRLFCDYHDVANALDLPIMGRTPSLVGSRGREIAHWLAEHPEVESYAIVDDDADMLDGQLSRFVKTHGHEGLTWNDFNKLCALFNVNPYDGDVRRRNWGTGEKLIWTGDTAL